MPTFCASLMDADSMKCVFELGKMLVHLVEISLLYKNLLFKLLDLKLCAPPHFLDFGRELRE